MSCTISNTGNPNCPFVREAPKLLYYQSVYDSVGNENKVLSTETPSQAWIEAKLNDPDPLKRWYPVTGIKNINPSSTEPTFKTFDDKTKELTSRPVRSLSFEKNKATMADFKFFNSCDCQEWGIYELDLAGNLIGYKKADGNLYGKKLSKGSVSITEMSAKDGSNSQTIMVQFDWDRDMTMANEGYITADSMGIDLALYSRGLVDYKMTKVSRTLTSLVLKFEHPSGAILPADGKFYQSLVIGDFKDPSGAYGITGAVNSVLFDKTANANVTISSVVFNSATNEYTLTIPSTPLINLLSANPVKTGFDFNNAKLVSLQ